MKRNYRLNNKSTFAAIHNEWSCFAMPCGDTVYSYGTDKEDGTTCRITDVL